MGNRAVIQFNGNKKLGMYLHWNGGRDSVEAFLKYAKMKGLSNCYLDYAQVRLYQIIGNFLGGNDSLGLLLGEDIEATAKGADNGLYCVDKNFSIVDRKFLSDNFTEQNEYDLEEMLISIDKAQPIKSQLGLEDYFKAKEVDLDDLSVGDKILHFDDIEVKYKKVEILGFGDKGQIVNGEHVEGIPYTDILNKSSLMEKINQPLPKDALKLNVNSYCFSKDGKYRKII